MKLTKEETQKVVLGGMMLCGLLYSYSEFLLAPLTGAREAGLKEITALEPQIKEATAQIMKAKDVEAKAPAAKHLLSQVNAMIPSGSPIAWLPTKVSDFFNREGVEKVSVRMVNETPEKDLTGFSRITWAFEAPKAGFVTFARALSAFENAEPLMEIQSLEIEAGRADVENQRVSASLSTIVRL